MIAGLPSTGQEAEQYGRQARLLPAVLLLLVISFFAVATVIWHLLDTSPIEFDQPAYFTRSVLFYKELQARDFARLVQDFNLGMGPLAPSQRLRPVLVPLLTSLTYAVFGPSRAAAIATVAGFTPVLLFFCYQIGKAWEGWKAGILASLFVLSFPVVAILSRQYLFDVPLAAIVAGTIYFLVRKDSFINPATSIAVGILVGLGMLTRETYPLFVAGPLVFGLGVFLRRIRCKAAGHAKPATLIALAGAVVLALGMAVPFYFPKISGVFQFAGAAYGSVNWAARHGIENASLFDRWAAYTIVFLRVGVTIPYLALLTVAAAALVIRRRTLVTTTDQPLHTAFLPIILTSFLVPYAACSLSTANDLRYTAAAFPAFAVLLAAAVVRATRGNLQPFLLSLLGAYALLQFWTVSFAVQPIRVDPVTTFADIPGSLTTVFGGRIDPVKNRYLAFIDTLAVPRQEDWQVHEMLTVLDHLRTKKDLRHAKVFLLSRSGQLNAGPFVSNIVFESLPFDFYSPSGNSMESSLKLMTQSDFLLVRDKNNGGEDVEALVLSVNAMPFQPTEKRFLLPDGSTIVIWERRS